MKKAITITSMEKGKYGQWIVTAEINNHFYSKQYYGYNKKQALSMAKEDFKKDYSEGQFGI